MYFQILQENSNTIQLFKLGDVLPIGHMVINRIGDLRRVAGKHGDTNQYQTKVQISLSKHHSTVLRSRSQTPV